MADDSGRPTLVLESEGRAARESTLEHPGSAPLPPAPPERGLHIQDEHGLRLAGGPDLLAAPNGAALVKTVDAEGRVAVTTTGVLDNAALTALTEALEAEESRAEGAESTLAEDIAAIAVGSGVTIKQVEEVFAAGHPLSGGLWTLGTTNSITPDLRKGRYFTATAGGTPGVTPVKLKPPTNPPASASTEVLEVAIRLKGNNPVVIEGMTVEGELNLDRSSSSVENVIPLETPDGGAHWFVVGDAPPPPDVPRIEGTPKDGDAFIFNEATGKWFGGTITAGLSKAEVETIAASAASTAAAAAVSSGASKGAFRLGTGTNTTVWESFANAVGERAAGRLRISDPITSSQALLGPVLATTITNGSTTAVLRTTVEVPVGARVTATGIPSGTTVVSITDGTHIVLSAAATKTETVSASYEERNVLYPLTVAGITATMPTNSLIAGAKAVIVNASGGAIKLKGKWRLIVSTTLTSGSTTAVVSSSTAMTPGASALGSGIPAGATVASVTDATHIVLSEAATKSETVNVLYVASEESVEEVRGQEAIVYTSDGVGTWRPEGGFRSLAQLEALIASTALTAVPSLVAAGYAASSFDVPGSSNLVTLGHIHMAKIMVPKTITIKELWVAVAKVGAGLTSALSGIYSSAGVLLAEPKENLPAQLESIGPGKLKLKPVGGGTTLTITGGPAVFVYAAILVVGGTAVPELGSMAYVGGRTRDLNAALATVELRAAEGRNAANEATYTALPAELALSNSIGKAGDVPFFWMGLK